MTLQDQITLLEEKGFLSENFKTGTHVAYWLRDLQERFELCRSQALVDKGSKNFFMETMGRFSDGLELVSFTFRFTYDPQQETVGLKSVNTRLGKHTKTYILADSQSLKTAAEMYEILSAPNKHEEYKGFYQRLQREYERDHDPENDYKASEDQPRRRIGKLEISGEKLYQPPKSLDLPAQLKKYIKR